MKKMKWTVQDIRKILDEVDEKYGTNMKNIPIEINPRLRRAIGRYVCYSQSRKPVKFDFSVELMNVADFRAVRDVVLHEVGHYIVNTHRKSKIGHTAEFRQVVKDLGSNNYNATCSSFVSEQLRAAHNSIIEAEQEIQEFEEALPPVQEEQPVEQPKEEVKEQPKKSTKGRTIARYDLDDNLIDTGYRAYYIELGFRPGNLSKACTGKLEKYKNYKFKYLD